MTLDEFVDKLHETADAFELMWMQKNANGMNSEEFPIEMPEEEWHDQWTVFSELEDV